MQQQAETDDGMVNRMKIRVLICSAVLAGTLLMTGCSVTDNLQNLTGNVDNNADQSTEVKREGVSLKSENIDPTLEKPVFDNELVSVVNVTAGGSAILEAKATANGSGSITYQWYSNNVSKNGGGTIIEGATGNIYEADTSEDGTTFYYAVASYNEGGRCNKATSGVYEVTVWGDMYWQQNAETHAYQFISRIDGGYPKATRMTIEGKEYIFDQDGFAVLDTGAYLDLQTGEAVVIVSTGDDTSEASPDVQQTEETKDAGKAE